MKKFYARKVQKRVGIRTIAIGFNKNGNKHLFSDAGHRSRTLRKADLLRMPEILERSQYIKSAELSKERKDRISRFHYFKATLHRNIVYLNVAEEERDGRLSKFYLYAATDKIK